MTEESLSDSPLRYQYQSLDTPQGIHFRTSHSHGDQLECFCRRPHTPLARDDSSRNELRHKRSNTDSIEELLKGEKLEYTPLKKSKSSFKSSANDDFKNLQGDTFVLERIRQKRQSDPWNLLTLPNTEETLRALHLDRSGLEKMKSDLDQLRDNLHL